MSVMCEVIPVTVTSEEELCEKIRTISILGIRSKTTVTKKVLENANIDTQEARDIIVSGRFDLMNLLIDGEYGKGYLNGFRYCLCNCEDIDIV